MAVIEKERVVERPRIIETVPPPPTRSRTIGMLFWMLAVAAVAVVVVVAIVATTGDEPAATTEIDVRSDQQKLADLAGLGYIPSEAVDWQLLRTEELVNRGLIPSLALHTAATPPTAPLFSDADLFMIELAQTGRIPMQSVDWQEVELKRLVNRGLIPRAALEG
jgi:hypothetical protein